MITKEIYKDVPNYKGLYQVSDLGNVKSLGRYVKHCTGSDSFLKEKILKPVRNSSGYLAISLSKNGIVKIRIVHQLVAIVFHNHKPCGMELVINHKNFIKTDNRAVNLEIVTQRENSNHKHLKSSSKYTGVTFDKHNKKWKASIYINRKHKNLGRFTLELEASKAYQNELKKYHTHKFEDFL